MGLKPKPRWCLPEGSTARKLCRSWHGSAWNQLSRKQRLRICASTPALGSVPRNKLIACNVLPPLCHPHFRNHILLVPKWVQVLNSAIQGLHFTEVFGRFAYRSYLASVPADNTSSSYLGARVEPCPSYTLPLNWGNTSTYNSNNGFPFDF